MKTISASDYPQEWVKILAKGMITIPKPLREGMGLKEGEVAKIKRVGKRLVIEPREVTDYELFSDRELETMLEEDKLPQTLADEAAALWPDLA